VLSYGHAPPQAESENMEYLKNVLLRFIEMGEASNEPLLQVGRKPTCM
jgi:hypothetical protein